MKEFIILIICLTSIANRKYKDKIRIGVSLPTKEEEIWRVYHKYFSMQHNKTSPADPHVRQEILIEVSINKKVSEQQVQVEGLLASDIDVLIIGPHDTKAAANLVEYAHIMNVNVISFVRMISNSKVDAYIAPNPFMIGGFQGEFLTTRAKSGKYLLFSGATNDMNSIYFYQEAMSFIKPLNETKAIEIVEQDEITDWKQNLTYNYTTEVLKKHDINAILAPNDNIAEEAARALRDYNKTHVTLTGCDCVQQGYQILKDSDVNFMTIDLNPMELVLKTLNMSLLLSDNKPIDFNKKINNGKYEIPSYLMNVSRIYSTDDHKVKEKCNRLENNR